MVNVHKFVAKTAREALAQLKAELGGDAVVLSNRAVPEGVEIVAMPAEAMGDLSATVRQARQPVRPAISQPAKAPQRAVAPADDADDDSDFTVTLGQHIARIANDKRSASRTSHEPLVFHSGLDEAANAAAPATRVKAFEPPRVNVYGEPLPRVAAEPARAAARPVVERRAEPDEKVEALESANAHLMDELSSIKGMLERQLAGFAWSEISREAPTRTALMSELLEVGFSAQLTRKFTEGLPAESTLAEGRNIIKNQINRQLRVISSDADIIDRGGVYALVGPTGVGKTTTTAKLAARCVVRHGADKLALITTDGYRIGAHEQLRIYGRILGVQVHVVRDAADLRHTLQELRNKHMVLIDTIGMSQRDQMVMDQAAMLNAAGNVRRLLLLNATVRGDTLDDVVRAYDHKDLAGCIFTKLDEAASLAPALDVAIRHELNVYYAANGQRVPEDLHLPNRAYLIHRALRELSADSPYKLDRVDTGLLMSAAASQHAVPSARGARS